MQHFTTQSQQPLNSTPWPSQQEGAVVAAQLLTAPRHSMVDFGESQSLDASASNPAAATPLTNFSPVSPTVTQSGFTPILRGAQTPHFVANALAPEPAINLVVGNPARVAPPGVSSPWPSSVSVDPRVPPSIATMPPALASFHHNDDDGSSEYSQTNVFVCHLPAMVGDEELRRLFESFGEIESSVVMRDIHTGQSRGVGFVQFTQPQSAQLAIEQMNRAMVHGKSISVQQAKRFSKGEPTTRVFVRNIPRSVTDAQLYDVFSKYGDIAWLSLHEDSVKGTAHTDRNIAFVNFATKEGALAAAQGFHNTEPFEDCKGITLLTKVVLENLPPRRCRRMHEEPQASTTATSAKPLQAMAALPPPPDYYHTSPPQATYPVGNASLQQGNPTPVTYHHHQQQLAIPQTIPAPILWQQASPSGQQFRFERASGDYFTTVLTQQLPSSQALTHFSPQEPQRSSHVQSSNDAIQMNISLPQTNGNWILPPGVVQLQPFGVMPTVAAHQADPQRQLVAQMQSSLNLNIHGPYQTAAQQTQTPSHMPFVSTGFQHQQAVFNQQQQPQPQLSANGTIVWQSYGVR